MAADAQLVLVRHGETEWTEQGLLHGRLDSPLSATGRRHASETAARLQGERFDALYSSPRGRALETATIIGRAVGLSPVPLEGVQEMYYGWLEGKPLSHVDPDGVGPLPLRAAVRLVLWLTGERVSQAAQRVQAAVAEVTARHPGGRLLIVTHWGTLSMIMAQLLDGNPAGWRNHGPWAACGISELHGAGGRWQVVRLNEHDHLSLDGATPVATGAEPPETGRTS